MGWRGSDSSPRWTVERCWASGPTQSLMWPLSWCNCYSYYQMWDRVNPEQGFINARNTLLCQNFNESFHFEAKGLAKNWHPFLKYPWKSLLLKKKHSSNLLPKPGLAKIPSRIWGTPNYWSLLKTMCSAQCRVLQWQYKTTQSPQIHNCYNSWLCHPRESMAEERLNSVSMLLKK